MSVCEFVVMKDEIMEEKKASLGKIRNNDGDDHDNDDDDEDRMISFSHFIHYYLLVALVT